MDNNIECKFKVGDVVCISGTFRNDEYVPFPSPMMKVTRIFKCYVDEYSSEEKVFCRVIWFDKNNTLCCENLLPEFLEGL